MLTGQGGMLTRLEQLPEHLVESACSFLGTPVPDGIARSVSVDLEACMALSLLVVLGAPAWASQGAG